MQFVRTQCYVKGEKIAFVSLCSLGFMAKVYLDIVPFVISS